MVWALFPADPLSGEEKYYIFTKGTYKVGRRGCDVIISKDKGVSRIHAEIVVEEMTSMYAPTSATNLTSRVRIRDCSKYGTFINKNLEKKEKVHEFPNKESTLKDGDLISFGTGNALYRFFFVPLVFFLYHSESFPANHLQQEKVSSIGARVSYSLTEDCTHVLVDELMPVNNDLLDAIVANKPIVLKSWVQLIAGKSIDSEMPNWTSYIPTLTFEGVSVKVDLRACADCLKGYACIMGSRNMYKFGDRLQPLLELGGAKVIFIEDFCSNSQALDFGENLSMVCIVPRGSANTFDHLSKLSSLSRADEVDLLCAVLSGHLDSSVLISPPVVVSSSCSTDETIVADSEAEIETATSVHIATNIFSEKATEVVRATTNIRSEEAREFVRKEEMAIPHPPTKSQDGHVTSSMSNSGGMTARIEKVDGSESGNTDVIFSQVLIVKDLNSPTIMSSTKNNGVSDFKRFRKRNIQSGNSFTNLIPFSKYPYKDSDVGDQNMAESVKEEKRRKQMEAIVEDLFNNEKGRRRGIAGSLHGLLTRG